MSDGISDANAVGRLELRLYNAAVDLKEAIRGAKNGHRGLTVDIIATVNEVLEGTGYRLHTFYNHEEP